MSNRTLAHKKLLREFSSAVSMKLSIALLVTLGSIGIETRRAVSAQKVNISAIRLEIGLANGATISSAHRWSRKLSNLGLRNVRIKTLRGGTSITVKQTGEGASASYTVYAVLNQRNVLITPGGKFTLGNTDALIDWLKTVGQKKKTKAENDNKPAAFGLTKKQLERASLLLSPAYTPKTKGGSAKDVITAITKKLGGSLVVSSEVENIINADDKIRDELKGLSYGTTLTAILRPMGLVLIPQATGKGTFQLVIVSSKGVKEIWPIGWKPTKPAGKLVPSLVKVIKIEASNTISLSDALSTVTPRLKIPVLFDHNSMLRKKIDPTQIPIEMKSGRFTYSNILKTILGKGKLKYELRVDDNDQPFFWITPR